MQNLPKNILRSQPYGKPIENIENFLNEKIMKEESQEKDWVKVLYEVILKILTLGFYHIEKHRKDK